ncbi:hypothetical protein ACMZ4Y_10250 [Prevotella histicola]
MKRIFSLATLICLFIVALTSISCSKTDDPTDNEIFIGTYKGRITYSGNGIKKSAENGSITVIKAADSYYFRFSDGIPDLKGVTFKKEGDHTLVNIDLKEGLKIIRIDASSLHILYTKDGKIWTANGKR